MRTSIFRTMENKPLDHPLETNLFVYGEIHSIDSVREAFMGTTHARALATMEPRFHGYFWLDKAKFREKFGPDVDPMQHGPYQARTVAIPLIDAQRKAGNELPQMTKEMEDHFVAYHSMHDDHEGTYAKFKDMTHDIAEPVKTQGEIDEEYNLWKVLNEEFHGDQAASFQKYVDQFVDQNSGFSARVWNVSEKIGYFGTGLRAFELATQDPDLDDNERAISGLMAREVVGRALSSLLLAREEIAFVDDILRNHDRQFTGIAKQSGISVRELRNG